MKNIAIILAGGSGKRMNTMARPKQFLELKGKPVIIYTLELFDNHPLIDGIICVCIESWIPFLEEQLKGFGINKVCAIVPGGETGQDSIYNGLVVAHKMYGENCNVLIHDGVRPLITGQTISDCVNTVTEKGNCITSVPATETLMVKNEDGTLEMPIRDHSFIAKAPQCFRLMDLLNAHHKSQEIGKHDFIDSCTMMNYYGHKLNTIIGPMENIKITTPIDFFIFRAMVQEKENKEMPDANNPVVLTH